MILSSLLVSFWILLDISCLKSLIWIFLRLRDGTCRRWLAFRILQLGSGCGLGTSLKHSHYPGFLVWLFSWDWLKPLVSRFLGVYIAMVPKADGDSTPWVNGPSACSRLCTGCGLPFGLDICGCGLRGGYLSRCLVSVMVHFRWPGSPLRWILKNIFPGLVGVSHTLWSLMSSSPSTLWTGLFWIAFWSGWDCLTSFVGHIFFS